MEENQAPKEETPQEGQVQQSANSGNTNAALTYVLGWITGLIFLLTEKEDDNIRFHAAQSLVVFGTLNIITFIPVVNFISIILWPVGLILWIVFMVKAYQGERFTLPGIEGIVDSVKNSIG